MCLDHQSTSGAACSSRAATLTASPLTSPWPSVWVVGDHLARVDALPVASRPPRLEFELEVQVRHRQRISAAARTARRASSSWTVGTPKAAITASPMNFSAVPPCRSSTTTEDVEVPRHDLAECLGVELLAETGRALEVGEHDGDGLANLVGRSGWCELGAAVTAQTEARRVLLAATWADGHDSP